ncbi:MAG: hypothetical protein K2O28_03770 [Clostridia bacterium]|nr:hypothetical protein [Clostridia bacterium]
MKRTKFLVILVALIVALTFTIGACSTDTGDYTVSVDTSKSCIIEVGDTIDYNEYFIVKDKNGYRITVTRDMVDTDNENTAAPGYFTVTLTIGKASQSLSFIVVPKDDGNTGNTGGNGNTGSTGGNGGNGGTGGNGSTSTGNTNLMDKQTYNAATFDDNRLQDKLVSVGKDITGLPSTGTYNALVIPIKFSNTTVSQTDLSNLNIAFNGTSEQTGWESVKTYYQKASYGKLNLSFDIAGYNMGSVSYYTASNSSTYYAGLTATDQGQTYNNGDNVLLHEVLKYYESKLDLTKYDYNKDGTLDAVYLLYSAPVDYDDGDFWWAYVTWNYDETKYDGKDAYYYMFTGIGFMEESVKGGYTNEYYPEISGLKINAATYIHETGHLLGLDDYYDYEENKGSDEGLGGADMMDATVGDQNVYSKTMLGWLDPKIVTSTQTITIQSSQAKGDAILVPLKFDNSYFCEYLLIDLYSAQGLNKLHASVSNSYLYDGAAYGVRIYHVSSWIKNPYKNDYQSFTDYNNTSSDISLIKLVEADGETKFKSSDGWAMDTDLWKTGGKLSSAFPKYTTNDGKYLIFDIKMDSVSSTQATITITYNS